MGSEEDTLTLELLKRLIVDGLHTLGLEPLYLLVIVDDVPKAIQLLAALL